MPSPSLPLEFPGGCLRRLHVDDLVAFQVYRADEELGRYQGWRPMGDEAARAFLVEMAVTPLFAAGQWAQLAIAAPGGELLGDIGLHLSEDGRVGEVGFTLSRPAQGRGLAAAAVRAALDVFFAATAAEEVRGITDERNLPSIRLLERLGFALHATRAEIFRGEPCIERLYVLPRGGRPAS